MWVIYGAGKYITRTVWSFTDILPSGGAGFIVPLAFTGTQNLPTILIICPVIRLTHLPIPAVHRRAFLSWWCELFNHIN